MAEAVDADVVQGKRRREDAGLEVVAAPCELEVRESWNREGPNKLPPVL
jgi:hypothetical protein